MSESEYVVCLYFSRGSAIENIIVRHAFCGDLESNLVMVTKKSEVEVSGAVFKKPHRTSPSLLLTPTTLRGHQSTDLGAAQ